MPPTSYEQHFPPCGSFRHTGCLVSQISVRLLTQKGGLDITVWLIWFLDTLNATSEQAQQTLTLTLAKSRFWPQHGSEPLSTEQIKVLNRILDSGENGFLRGISASQHQEVAKVSKAIATYHVADLLEKG